jgi:hypothetical protein
VSISFLLDEKPTIVRGGCGQSGREAREISFIQLLARNSERAAPSACVGKQFSTVRLSGIDRLDELSFPHSLRFTGSFANGSSTRDRPNSGPHPPNSAAPRGAGDCGPLPMLRGKEPFSPAWRIAERNG